jgi:DNA polymerase-3 subunit epsilon
MYNVSNRHATSDNRDNRMRHHPRPADRNAARQWARDLLAQPNFYVLDTETTGTGKKDEVVQIGIVDKHGHIVLDTLVKPTISVPARVTRIHGITNAMLKDAPELTDLYVTLSIALAGAPLIAYNMSFDWRLLSQSVARFNLPMLRTGARHCAMKTYAQFRGVKSKRGAYRWHKLTVAAQYENIPVTDAHSALGDVRMTLALIQKMAD